MNPKTLYIIGLVLALLYILMGFDDFVWDIFSFFKRAKYRESRLDFTQLRKKPPKLLAMTIGAWNESAVIGDVIENLISSIQYPKSMYHLFVGVYPNDQATIDIVSKIAEQVPNVHMIVNSRPGPTTKAQNINHVISQIKQFEKDHGWQFASVTVHDAEDVVHPYELLVTNYLIDKYGALQFPVFPLKQMPTFRNFFRNLTASTYADEFAENHYVTMVGRTSTGAFVPSAGTGFALSRKTIYSFDTDEILPSDSLTEDYKLSFILYKKKIPLHYVLDRIPRVAPNGKIVYDYVATRSMFPFTFKTAVKQKTRWILGITMQSVAFRDIFVEKNMPFVGKYSLYKDLKAKISNLLVFVGYPVFVYFIVSLFITLTPIYPKGTFSWYLSVTVTIMMIERQISRAIAIYHVYGMRSVFFSCLMPPIMPLQIVWGNIINMTATFKAYFQSISKNKEAKKKKQPAKAKKFTWSKTDHTFLPKSVLKRYHRTYGDILIEKGLLDTKHLQDVLKKKPEDVRIGKFLLDEAEMSEEQVLSVLADVKHIPYILLDDSSAYNIQPLLDKFDIKLLKQLKVIPIHGDGNRFVIAYCEDSPDNAQTILRETYGIAIESAFTSEETVNKVLQGDIAPFVRNEAYARLASGRISIGQYILIMNYSYSLNRPIDDIMKEIGLTAAPAEVAQPVPV